ncbi:MAG: hypothetical protein FD152_749 [Xanthobacteraceae bacterium]|nr:MAG: hypothetical protein FD152_749 [Xanthobacteraceae bacterium]
MTDLRLDPRQQAVLCDLADPEGSAPPAEAIACFGPEDLLDLARYHAIEAVLWRKLAPVSGSLSGPWAGMIAELTERVRIATSVTMLLEAHATRIVQGLNAQGLRHRLVKGAAFAASLYPEVSDRPYTDVDILVPAESLDEVANVMHEAGFALAVLPRPEKTEIYREQKWTREGEPHLLVEVHTDLVHLPALRRRVTFGFREAEIADHGGTAIASGQLLTAVVHGAIGHKFHQLKLAVDVLQAIRRLGDTMPLAIEAAHRLNLTFELAAAASLVGRLFPGAAGDPRIAELGALVETPRWLDRDTITNAHLRGDIRSRFRRFAFRWQQKRRAGSEDQ